MARKKLFAKKETQTKPSPLVKKLKAKTIKTFDLFSTDKTIYASSTLVTNDNDIVLITVDSDQFLLDNKIENDIRPFDVDEDHLQIEFNRKESIEPIYNEDEAIYTFESIGNISKIKYDWFKNKYPMCKFYQINKWFGKEVNTLVIVLVEDLGKPVAILKTTE